MMRNPFAINNGDLDGGDARAEVRRYARVAVVAKQGGRGWPSRGNPGKEVVRRSVV